MPLVEAFHTEAEIELDNEARRAGVAPLLDGSPYGAVYLIGPARAPIGHIIACFSWSVEMGGMDAILDEIYLRPAVRGRGIAFEALTGLAKTLSAAGIKAMWLEVDRGNERAQRLYSKAGFKLRESYAMMLRRL